MLKGGGGKNVPPKPPKICKEWGTAYASASSKPRDQEKIKLFLIFVILLEFSITFKNFLITFKILNKIFKMCPNFFLIFLKSLVHFLFIQNV